MPLKIYDNGGKTADRFTVIFSTGDIYLMSHNANMPNGVCVYFGQENEPYNFLDKRIDKPIKFNMLPQGVQKQIQNIILCQHLGFTN